MSELNSRATVELQINGQQARNRLNELRQNALQLETALARAAAAGNKVDLKKIRKELTDTKRQIREMESSTMQVEQVLKSLDKATPKELQKTLQNLTRQLEYIERGSAAWDEQVAKIKKVKAEIASINVQMREQESFWSRMNMTINNWSMTIMGAIATLSGFVMAGRNAVKAFADMDEEMANTRKYTGMTVEEVDELNESFKKLNTRTSRAELNELAQEAGRLGKRSLEDVQGYVEASNIIKVALVDLGEGATQTIAKLTNIFGVEEIMGTKDAMLAVGSTVNVLSQNCTASKPYLVDFAQRMAGIGAQAKLSIPEILAFGATLDANGQKVEMASSAISKLIMKLFQDTSGIAQQVGLDVNQFTQTLQKSTNEGLMMFLEKIHQLGGQQGLAVLAPMFKDLGMDGVRMAQVLATLAEHLDMVKWEQTEANKAFREATSATNEYNIFNNTTQASLDKAKNRVHELSIELGEKLLPLMRHIYTSASIFLRVLNVFVDFVKKYKTEIIVLTSAIVAYTVVLNTATILQKAHNAYLLIGQTLTKGYTAVVRTLTAAKLALEVVMGKLKRNWVQQASAMCDAKTAGVSLTQGYAALAAAAIVLVAAVVKVVQKYKEHREELRKQREAARAYSQAASDLSRKTAENSAAEISQLKTLYEQATLEAGARDKRRQAAERLQALYPAYFKNMSTEQIMVGQAKSQYDTLCSSILKVAKARAAAEKIQENMEEVIRLEGELENGKVWQKNAKRRADQSQKDYDQAKKKADEETPVSNDSGEDALQHIVSNSNNDVNSKAETAEKNRENLEAANNYVKERTKQIDALNKANEKLVKKYGNQEGFDTGNPETKLTPETISETVVGEEETNGSKGSKAKENKFAYEKAWKEREEALTRIQYAQGKIDYEKYTTDMLSIDTQYYAEMLSHSDLSADERTSLEAKYFEAERKQKDEESKLSIQEENNRYNEELSILKQRYIDGESTTATYENAAELAELAHLRRMVSITTEGSDERLAAEKAYQDKLFANQKKRQQEAEKLAKEHQEKLKKIKENVFGMNPSERQTAYEADLELLKEVFDKEIKAAENNAKEKLRIEKAFYKAKLALAKQYNVSVSKEGMNAMEKWNDDIMDFLDSDTGKAITGGFETMVSGMSSLFSGLTSIVESELEIQTAAIESRYEKELSLCEGNTYMEKKLEKQKEADIAKAKNEANKKAFAMQVIQAVAQTAVSAINAYSSAAAVPLIGYILAPIAAATAVAAGMVQIAALKKQQQASEAQGYASGGYTKKGAKYEEAGIVHAGEWVASQELLSNPVASQMIQTLDYAQRTNTIGSLTSDDVSSAIMAPAVLAKNSTAAMNTPKQVIVKNAAETGGGNGLTSEALSDYAQVMKSLKDRLDQPFLTVNSITGDTGIEQAQSEYDRLIRNKTPKSRR